MTSSISEYFTFLDQHIETENFSPSLPAHTSFLSRILNCSLARNVCAELIKQLEKQKRIDFSVALSEADPAFGIDYLFGPARGQMFGVLVCQTAKGELGYLKAFSCQYNGRWLAPGWVPPVFEHDNLIPYQRKIEARIKELGGELERHELGSPRHQGIKRQRKNLSRELMEHIHDQYELRNYAYEKRPLKSFFYPRGIPTGTADCCAPKLINFAVKNGLYPLGMAEFFWGKENKSGTRGHGVFYPPCEDKCSPILGFMLRGTEPRLDIVYLDDTIIVVDKPAGVLAIPGKGEDKWDCVENRVRVLTPHASGPLTAHRLDMATSGLMVLGLTPEAQRDLSIQFQQRAVEKKYIAVLDGDPEDNSGSIVLPFRVDLNNRPYQILDPVHGKMGKTFWRKLSSENRRCRVEFTPITGRTHQLRVHSAHKEGLGCPIVGDALYGDPNLSERLLLHASDLTIEHPKTRKRMEFHSPVPF